MTRRRVVITGYGAVSSLGDSVSQIWDSLMQYKLGYRVVNFDDKNMKAKFFAFIDADKRRYEGLPKAILKMVPEFARYAMVASREALNMAFGVQAKEVIEREAFECGVIIGTGWGGADALNQNNNDYRASGLASSFSTLMSMPSAATAAVALHWKLRGYQNTPVAACASGTIAIGDAYEIIKSGRAKVMLAGGSESLKEQFNVWSVDVIQALSKEQHDPDLACCPFDARRSGFVLAEGCAVLCLEEMEHALSRGATILGEITAYANYSDAYDMTAPAEDLKARQRCILQVLRDAGRHPGQLDYVNLHGTSTPLNDRNETMAIKLAVGDAAYAIPMSSTKSYTGHMIGAAGAIESIFCLKAIETGIIPATVHLNEKDEDCDLDYTPNTHASGREINTTLNLSFGFGGANGAVLIERFDAERREK